MEATVARKNKRAFNQLRRLRVTYNIFDFADGSLLFECGRTKIMCAVTLQHGVPQFMRGEKSGWLTAEYAMLPAATRPRTVRDAHGSRPNQRNVEISRLIGRALRAVCDLSVLGEYTITVDCDVLQADAGTRTASISAASVAIALAQEVWLKKGFISAPVLKEKIAAVSIGYMQGSLILDPDYSEDSVMDADVNFILTASKNLIEVQGGAEKNQFSWATLHDMYELACHGVEEIFTFFERTEKAYFSPAQKDKEIVPQQKQRPEKESSEKLPLFSLQNRFSVNK
jgi:ribonuclease PH